MITVISGYTDTIKDLASISFSTIEKYCKYNNINYDVSIIPKNYSRPYSWFKVEKLIKYTSSNIGYTLWIDADAIIINNNFNLYSIIKPDKYIYVSRDFNNINCGSILIQNNTYTTKFLIELWNQVNFINHIWWEQGAFIHLCDNNFMDIKNHIEYIPQHIFNAYDYNYYDTVFNIDGHINEDSFIFHTPGLPNQIKLKLLKEHII